MVKENNGSKADAQPASGVRQRQTSTQSMQNPSQTGDQRSDANPDQPANSAMGSTAEQNRGRAEERIDDSSQRRSAGTPDIAREPAADTDVERAGGGSSDSLVNDSTGAFKERP